MVASNPCAKQTIKPSTADITVFSGIFPIRMTEELPASKLGTKEHWDMVYERETKEYEVRSPCFIPEVPG
jgi:hypothetical protein